MKLTQQDARAAIKYDPETGEMWWKWREGVAPATNGRFAGKPLSKKKYDNGRGAVYLKVTINRENLRAHQVAWVWANGPIPRGMEIDHIDGDGTNNALANLRLVSHKQNARNMRRRAPNPIGVSGVSKHSSGKSWLVQLSGAPNRVFVCLGKAAAHRKQFDRKNGYTPLHGGARS